MRYASLAQAKIEKIPPIIGQVYRGIRKGFFSQTFII
jgi:hypothetical protein